MKAPILWHRFFVLPPGGATLILRNVTLSDGRSPHATFAVTNENSFDWDYDDANAGGAILVSEAGVLHATNVGFRQNQAPLGGAVRESLQRQEQGIAVVGESLAELAGQLLQGQQGPCCGRGMQGRGNASESTPLMHACVTT